MTTLEHFKKYFTLPELFSTTVCNKFGEQAWSFLDPRLMEVLIWLREAIKQPITINTRTMQQRGFRENTCKMVSDKTAAGKTYCSAHMRGQGVDLDVKNIPAENVRNFIRYHADELPHHIRLEAGVSWVHIDVCNITNQKIYEFKA